MDQKLKMKDITQITGVSKSTVLYHLSLGLLPEPLKTSKNTAYYPASYLKIIPAIRYLQERMHLPLAVIKQLIDGIGFDNFSIDQALHNYETFLNPLQNGGKDAVYGKKDLAEASRLEEDEMNELEGRGLLYSLAGEAYYHDDLLAASAYRKLKDLGIAFAEVEGLTHGIRDLAREVHELYHAKAAALNRETEQDMTRVMRVEFETVFKYLINKHLLLIYKEENS
ncbi:MAG: MerR family transcriptional regulator [Peptococcaceae bacterium]|nr:MerR family transcriptional regulator [Peptococcaceae bacterium]